jgi:hypothetical protein
VQAPVGVAGDDVAEVVVVVHEHDAAPVDAEQVHTGVADGGERSDQVTVRIASAERPQTGFHLTTIDTHQLLLHLPAGAIVALEPASRRP